VGVFGALEAVLHRGIGLYAALERRSSTVVLAVVPQFKIQNKIRTSVKSDGQECPSHMAGSRNPLLGLSILAAGRGPSTAHDVHFVGAMLRSA
jgi:hypothetical protein